MTGRRSRRSWGVGPALPPAALQSSGPGALLGESGGAGDKNLVSKRELGPLFDALIAPPPTATALHSHPLDRRTCLDPILHFHTSAHREWQINPPLGSLLSPSHPLS